MVQEIKSLAEFNDIINSGKVVFIDFWASWCGPCKFISPVFEKLDKEHGANDQVAFYKVNVDDAGDVAQECGIRAMPTFQVFHQGQKINELVGAKPNDLQALILTGLTVV